MSKKLIEFISFVYAKLPTKLIPIVISIISLLQLTYLSCIFLLKRRILFLEGNEYFLSILPVAIVIHIIILPLLYFISNRSYSRIKMIIGMLIITIIISLTSLHAPITNPDSALYIFMGEYFQSHGIFNYFQAYGTDKFYSRISAPLIGVFLGTIYSISDNINIVKLLTQIPRFILSYLTYIIYLEENKINTGINQDKIENKKTSIGVFFLTLTIPYLISQSYLPLQDILSSVFFLLGIYLLLYKKNLLIGITGTIMVFFSFLTKYLLLQYIILFIVFYTTFVLINIGRKILFCGIIVSLIGLRIHQYPVILISYFSKLFLRIIIPITHF